MEVAQEEPPLVVPKMHAVAEAVFPCLAGSAVARFHPAMVPIRLEALVPYFHEVVPVDIALVVVGADAGTS